MKRIWAIGVALALAAVPASAKDLHNVKVTQAVASFSFLPGYYAKDAGYFADEGLNVQQIATRGGGPDIAALLTGDVDFNFGVGPYEIGAVDHNRKFVSVLNMENRPLISVVISKKAAQKAGITPDMPLKQRLQALKGLKMGMTRPGSLTDREIHHLMDIAGLKPSDVQIVAIGGAASLVSAFEQGAIDGYAISTPYDRLTVRKGEAVMLVDNPNGDDPSLIPFVMSDLITSPDMVKNHPHEVQGMVNALRRAMQDIRTKPAEQVVAVIQKDFGKLDHDLLVASVNATKKAISDTGMITPQMWKNTLLLDGRNVPVDKMMATFDPQFLKNK